MEQSQQPPQIQVTSDEIGQRWGQFLNQAFGQILLLEKRLEIQNQTIQSLEAQIAELNGHISKSSDLSPELARIAALDTG